MFLRCHGIKWNAGLESILLFPSSSLFWFLLFLPLVFFVVFFFTHYMTKIVPCYLLGERFRRWLRLRGGHSLLWFSGVIILKTYTQRTTHDLSLSHLFLHKQVQHSEHAYTNKIITIEHACYFKYCKVVVCILMMGSPSAVKITLWVILPQRWRETERERALLLNLYDKHSWDRAWIAFSPLAGRSPLILFTGDVFEQTMSDYRSRVLLFPITILCHSEFFRSTHFFFLHPFCLASFLGGLWVNMAVETKYKREGEGWPLTFCSLENVALETSFFWKPFYIRWCLCIVPCPSNLPQQWTGSVIHSIAEAARKSKLCITGIEPASSAFPT